MPGTIFSRQTMKNRDWKEARSHVQGNHTVRPGHVREQARRHGAREGHRAAERDARRFRPTRSPGPPDTIALGSGCFASIILKHLGRCCFVGLVVDSITTNHAVRPSLRRWPMMLMPNSILMRLSRYQTMWSFEHADELVHRVLGRPFRLHRGDRVRLRRNTTIRIPTIA